MVPYLPILHLNGYKIANPTILARIEPEELDQFLRGCGWIPYYVEGDEPEKMHQLMATVMEKTIEAYQRHTEQCKKQQTTPPDHAGQ